MQQQQISSLLPRGATTLFVASSGGHFEQLRRIEQASEPGIDSHWITFDTPQTRGALGDRPNVHYVPYIAPRDWRLTVRTARLVWSILKQNNFDHAVSTGAALAVAALPLAATLGIGTTYIESISRTEGPSLTGRMMRFTPRVTTLTQHRGWAGGAWRYRGSILDTWPSPTPSSKIQSEDGPLNIFVTLGTIKPYRFDRMIDAVRKIARADDTITWQVGCTARPGLPGVTHEEMSPALFRKHVDEADVVVTHSGVGTALQLLDHGITPVLAPRSQRHAEHIDDHQHLITNELRERNLALVLDLDNPQRETLLTAQATSTRLGSNMPVVNKIAQKSARKT